MPKKKGLVWLIQFTIFHAKEKGSVRLTCDGDCFACAKEESPVSAAEVGEHDESRHDQREEEKGGDQTVT